VIQKYKFVIQENVGRCKSAWIPGSEADALPWQRVRRGLDEPALDDIVQRRVLLPWTYAPVDVSWLKLKRMYEQEPAEIYVQRPIGVLFAGSVPPPPTSGAARYLPILGVGS